jgi:hypothetical protein
MNLVLVVPSSIEPTYAASLFDIFLLLLLAFFCIIFLWVTQKENRGKQSVEIYREGESEDFLMYSQAQLLEGTRMPICRNFFFGNGARVYPGIKILILVIIRAFSMAHVFFNLE